MHIITSVLPETCWWRNIPASWIGHCCQWNTVIYNGCIQVCHSIPENSEPVSSGPIIVPINTDSVWVPTWSGLYTGFYEEEKNHSKKLTTIWWILSEDSGCYLWYTKLISIFRETSPLITEKTHIINCVKLSSLKESSHNNDTVVSSEIWAIEQGFCYGCAWG